MATRPRQRQIPYTDWPPCQLQSGRPSASRRTCTTPSWASTATPPATTGVTFGSMSLLCVGSGVCQRMCPVDDTDTAQACRGGGLPQPGKLVNGCGRTVVVPVVVLAILAAGFRAAVLVRCAAGWAAERAAGAHPATATASAAMVTTVLAAPIRVAPIPAPPALGPAAPAAAVLVTMVPRLSFCIARLP